MHKKSAKALKSKIKIEILKIEEFWDQIRNQRQKFTQNWRCCPRSKELGYIIVRDGKIGVKYLKTFKIN